MAHLRCWAPGERLRSFIATRMRRCEGLSPSRTSGSARETITLIAVVDVGALHLVFDIDRDYSLSSCFHRLTSDACLVKNPTSSRSLESSWRPGFSSILTVLLSSGDYARKPVVSTVMRAAELQRERRRRRPGLQIDLARRVLILYLRGRSDGAEGLLPDARSRRVRDRRRDQEGLPQAGQEVPSRLQPRRSQGRRQVQGDQRGQRGPERPQEAQAVRRHAPLRQRRLRRAAAPTRASTSTTCWGSSPRGARGGPAGARAGAAGQGGQTFTFEDLGGWATSADIFSSIFDRGGRFRQERYGPQQGEDLYAEVEVPFELAVKGGKTVISVSRNDTCDRCRGTGAEPGSQGQPSAPSAAAAG